MPAQSRPTPSLTVRPDRPLIGIVLIEDGQEVTRYFADEADADAAIAARSSPDARTLARAWNDLDWNDLVEELDHIRHVNTPSPPIDDL